MTEEAWRPIATTNGAYEVSDIGRVRSTPRIIERRDGKPLTIRGRILKSWTKRSGHIEVNLGSNNPRRVHRLVLEAFVGPNPAGMMGCHNDGNPGNNRLDNLRWDTGSENSLDTVRHGRNLQALRTACPRNHPYDLANTYWYRGRRMCRKCRNMHAAKSRAKSTARLAQMIGGLS